MKRELIINGVGKSFGEFWAINDIHAHIHAGKITAFIGPNGAGKTTLFHVIAGELKPDKGAVLLNDQDITGLAPWEIARLGIGRQFQDVRVLPGLSAIDNVLIALLSPQQHSPLWSWKNILRQNQLLKKHKEQAEYWLKFVGLYDHKNHLARELSFGEQKLLSIARLMAGDFNIFLLDEPTAGVSHIIMDRLICLLINLVEKHGITIALIEHDMAVVKTLAAWVCFMEEGKLTFQGNTSQVLDNNYVRETYMGL